MGYTVQTESEKFECLGLWQQHEQAVQGTDQVLVVLDVQQLQA